MKIDRDETWQASKLKSGSPNISGARTVYVDTMERREPVKIQDARKISWELYVKKIKIMKGSKATPVRQKDDINCQWQITLSYRRQRGQDLALCGATILYTELEWNVVYRGRRMWWELSINYKASLANDSVGWTALNSMKCPGTFRLSLHYHTSLATNTFTGELQLLNWWGVQILPAITAVIIKTF